MVEQVIDDSHKKLRIITLEEEVEDLKQKLNENKEKYNENLSEALSTLKQVQDAVLFFLFFFSFVKLKYFYFLC